MTNAAAKKPVTYQICGPIAIPTEKNQGKTKRINMDTAPASLGELGSKRGCYIFGIRGSRGSIVPYYVGKTNRTFQTECFTDHKLNKYNDVLYRIDYGKPVMFLVVAQTSHGAPNRKALAALEEYLIGLGLQKNRDLKNIRGTKQLEPPFALDYVHTPRPGKPPVGVRSFRRAFGLR